MRKGQVVAFLKGHVGRAEESGLRAKDEVAALFKGMVEEIERNHATQASGWGWLALWVPLALLHLGTGLPALALCTWATKN